MADLSDYLWLWTTSLLRAVPLVVCLGLAVLRWGRHPRVSQLATGGAGFMLSGTVLVAVGYPLLFELTAGNATISSVLQSSSLVLNCVGIVLLGLAATVDRRSWYEQLDEEEGEAP